MSHRTRRINIPPATAHLLAMRAELRAGSFAAACTPTAATPAPAALTPPPAQQLRRREPRAPDTAAAPAPHRCGRSDNLPRLLRTPAQQPPPARPRRRRCRSGCAAPAPPQEPGLGADVRQRLAKLRQGYDGQAGSRRARRLLRKPQGRAALGRPAALQRQGRGASSPRSGKPMTGASMRRFRSPVVPRPASPSRAISSPTPRSRSRWRR